MPIPIRFFVSKQHIIHFIFKRLIFILPSPPPPPSEKTKPPTLEIFETFNRRTGKKIFARNPYQIETHKYLLYLDNGPELDISPETTKRQIRRRDVDAFEKIEGIFCHERAHTNTYRRVGVGHRPFHLYSPARFSTPR